jgi:hypothetical protein
MKEADIYIPPTEGSLVGIIPGLNGRDAVNEVIDTLLRKKLYHSKSWLKLQRTKGKSIEDIAKECGVSPQIVHVYLKKYGLK